MIKLLLFLKDYHLILCEGLNLSIAEVVLFSKLPVDDLSVSENNSPLLSSGPWRRVLLLINIEAKSSDPERRGLFKFYFKRRCKCSFSLI